MASAVALQGTQSANKNFHGRMAMDIVFHRKKQNSTRAKGMGVVSILAKVKKMQKEGN
jgi:hypothetical protein